MTAGPLTIAGVSLDCADPGELIRFYCDLLGGEKLWHDEAGAAMRVADGSTIVAQRVADYTSPTWPGTAIVHLDLDAHGDLDGAVAYAVRCGAQPARVQPDQRWMVLLDPAGHPFCITTEVWQD